MKKTTGEKKIGFYLVMAAAVLSLVKPDNIPSR